ncbi:MAG: hypothetical protein ACRYF3_06245, partial [Janthinobacterium lividum]
RLRGEVLRSAVDAGGGLRVLATDRAVLAAPPPEALTAVVEAARRTFALTVLDLPRAPSPAPVLAVCEEVLVVLPATTRAAAAACGVLDGFLNTTELGDEAPPVRLVVRDVGSGADPHDVAHAVGSPLAGVLRAERDLDPGLERGEGLPVGRRSAVRVFAERWVRDTLTGPGRAGVA